MTKTLLIINGSPNKSGHCAQIIDMIKTYFLEYQINVVNTFDLSPAPCIDCKYCENYDGCSNRDLDIFFEDFESADSIIFISPIYNNFFPAPVKAIIDRFQRYYNARFKRGAKPPIKKYRKSGLIIVAGSDATINANYMAQTLEQSLTVLNSDLVSKYFILNTDKKDSTYSLSKLNEFIAKLK